MIELIKSGLGDWSKVINISILINILQKLSVEYQRVPVTPDKSQIFKAFKLCEYNNLKVIMLGQDPYPQAGVATGILFGNREGVSEDALSPSLKIIKQAVISPNEPHGIIRFDNTLESWAKQGVLMINSALTVRTNQIGSHVMLWRSLISELLMNLSDYNPGLIYVLFGSQAQTFKPYINKNNTIFEVKHPAYYARTGQRFETTLFEDIAQRLKDTNNFDIKWYE